MAILNFDDAIRVGEPHELLAVRRDDPNAAPRIPSSGEPRGLALRRLTVTSRWDGLWRFLHRRKQIFFLSVAFDISTEKPIVLPPPDLPKEAVHQILPGQSIDFTLGLGPLCSRRGRSPVAYSSTSPCVRPTADSSTLAKYSRRSTTTSARTTLSWR